MIETETNRVYEVDPQLIEVNPYQPRKHFDEKALEELMASIALDGIVQPLVVQRDSPESQKLTLIAGERRLRAARRLGLKKVPVLLKETGTSQDLLRLGLIENLQRQDLNALEEAQAYFQLVHEMGLSHEECAKQVGKDRTTIINSLRLLSLPEEIKRDLLVGALSSGHARVLLSLARREEMLKARDMVLRKGLSVRKTEELCRMMKSGFSSKEDANEEDTKTFEASRDGKAGASVKAFPDPDLEYLADSLRDVFKTKIKILGSGAKGRIEVSYFSAAELERLVGLLSENKRP